MTCALGYTVVNVAHPNLAGQIRLNEFEVRELFKTYHRVESDQGNTTRFHLVNEHKVRLDSLATTHHE